MELAQREILMGLPGMTEEIADARSEEEEQEERIFDNPLLG